jgi:hypothetical protein
LVTVRASITAVLKMTNIDNPDFNRFYLCRRSRRIAQILD